MPLTRPPRFSAWFLRTLTATILTVTACGTGSAPTPTTPPKPTEAPKPAPATSAPTAAPIARPTDAPKPASAAPTPAAPGTPVAKEAAAEDLSALYEAAKKEGELNLYTTLNTNQGQPVVKVFMSKYPGVKVNYHRQSAVKLEEVMNQEAKAGKMPWDVVESNEDLLVRLTSNGYVQPYTPSIAAKYPDNWNDARIMGLTDRVNPFSPSVNTNLVKTEDYPKTWEDLTNPMWKGRLAVDETNVLLFTATKAEWGNEKALNFWKGIAANQPSIRSGNTETAQLLAAGEFPLAINVYTAEPGRLAQQGAPVKVIPIEPVFLQLQMVALGAKTEHPNAAKLFINWLLDDDGQQAMSDNGVPAARPEILVKAAPYLANVRLLPIPPDVAVKASDDREEWRQIMGI